MGTENLAKISMVFMTALFGGFALALFSGLPWYITVPGVLVGIFVLIILWYMASFVVPTLIASKAFRIARSVRPLARHAEAVPGFILPVGFWRLLANREEYVLAFLVCNWAGGGAWRGVLRMTRGQHLYETFGWEAEIICRYAMRQDDPRAVVVEAKELAQEHPLAEVVRYAGHPAGAKRGFELLRSSIPYEFGELMV